MCICAFVSSSNDFVNQEVPDPGPLKSMGALPLCTGMQNIVQLFRLLKEVGGVD